MRPVTLTMSGFRSHESETTIDFTGRRLFAIVGPTGSGKSSILDGISYALYGMTPREKKQFSNLICSSSDEAHVRLDFSIDGATYRVTRALSRKGKSEHLIEALDSGEKVIGKNEVAAKVEELLGLDFPAFCSSVLLAQGRFSEFLEAAATKRAQILKGAFRLEQIDDLRESAKGRVGDLRLEIATIEGRRAEIPEDVRDQHARAKEAVKHATARAGVLAKSVPVEKDLLKALDQITQEATQAETELRRATESMEKVPRAADLDVLVDEERSVTAGIEEAKEILALAGKEKQTAGQDLTKLEKKLGTRESLIEARSNAKRLLELAQEIADSEQAIAEKRELLAGAEQALEEATKSEISAIDELGRTRAERATIEQDHKAHALRVGLKKGEPCPVCEKVVSTIPRKSAPGPLKTIEKKEKSVEERVTRARSLVVDATKVVERTTTQVTGALETAEGARRSFKKLDASVQSAVGKAGDPIAEIEVRLKELMQAEERIKDAGDKNEQARAALDSCTKAETKFALLRQKAAAALIEVAGRIGLEAPKVDDAASALAGYAVTVRSALEEASANARSSVEKAGLRRTEVTEELHVLRVKLEVPKEEAIAEALADARTQEGIARARVESLAADIARDKELAGELATRVKRRSLFDRLAEDLTDRRFISFLLEDRRRLLSELASVRLQEMTGRYRFDDKGNFDIVDEFDGEKMRDHTTLSGGETFLASLALALGLAEAVTRHGGRLQCFFLDEGFGSLDAESLELAMDGIEEIVNADRLIGLVSHVQGLAQRIEDRIELAKGPDGMSIIKAGAAL